MNSLRQSGMPVNPLTPRNVTVTPYCKQSTVGLSKAAPKTWSARHQIDFGELVAGADTEFGIGTAEVMFDRLD